MRLSGDASPGDIIHAGFDVAFKNNKSPLILSFPRRRESILSRNSECQMDSRFRGNDSSNRDLLFLSAWPEPA